MRCADCKWWKQIETGSRHTGVGLCYRMPPTAGSFLSQQTNDDVFLERRGPAKWPTLRENDYCGEFQQQI